MSIRSSGKARTALTCSHAFVKMVRGSGGGVGSRVLRPRRREKTSSILWWISWLLGLKGRKGELSPPPSSTPSLPLAALFQLPRCPFRSCSLETAPSLPTPSRHPNETHHPPTHSQHIMSGRGKGGKVRSPTPLQLHLSSLSFPF